jgi:hypothetical protein
MLRHALSTLETDTTINMGFFVHALHHQIAELHQKQVSSYQEKPFVVYRGKVLSTTDFEKRCKKKGGLMSFNNFLSVSKTQGISLGFVKGALGKTDMVGILFKCPLILPYHPLPLPPSRRWVNSRKKKKSSSSCTPSLANPLHQVELTLTSNVDPQLCMLTERIEEETPDFID